MYSINIVHNGLKSEEEIVHIVHIDTLQEANPVRYTVYTCTLCTMTSHTGHFVVTNLVEDNLLHSTYILTPLVFLLRPTPTLFKYSTLICHNEPLILTVCSTLLKANPDLIKYSILYFTVYCTVHI